MRQEALALLQKGVILFQRKVYDGATRALMEYRRHLDGRSPDPVELRIATGLLGCRYGIADLVSGKNSNGDIVHAFRFRHWPLSMRMAFSSQICWRVRAALTVGDVGYALDLVKFSCRVFGLSATGADKPKTRHENLTRSSAYPTSPTVNAARTRQRICDANAMRIDSGQCLERNACTISPFEFFPGTRSAIP